MDIKIVFPSAEPSFLHSVLVDLAPHILWAAVVITIVFLIGPKKVTEAFLNAHKISFGGLEIDLKGEIADAVRSKNMIVLPQLQNHVTQRANELLPLIRGARLLWIDDAPSNNENEMRLLGRLGVIIDLAKSDLEAKQHLEASVYDLVISDSERGGVSNAGELFLPNVMQALLNPPVIFYVGHQRQIPFGAFGLTTRPDELVNLVLDAMVRKRG